MNNHLQWIKESSAPAVGVSVSEWVAKINAAETVIGAFERSGLDISPCMVCGLPVICVPDGLPCCENCEVPT